LRDDVENDLTVDRKAARDGKKTKPGEYPILSGDKLVIHRGAEEP
jgi:hypothetical protein